MSENVYVITGTTGEYSDRSLWHVIAFNEKSNADQFCLTINDWCKANLLYMDDCSAPHSIRDNIKCPYDAEFTCDYTGTEYAVVEMPLNEYPTAVPSESPCTPDTDTSDT